MGLPEFLFDSHKRYKADTNCVAAWLAETSQLKCGYTLMAQSPNASPTSTGRVITTQELVTMAEVIAGRKPPIKTPRFIVDLLRSAITLRTRCTKWFSSQARGQTAQNTAHSHFIGVLEKILQVLQPTVATSSPSSQHTDAKIDNISNLFDVLDIEESKMTENTSPTTSTAEPVAPKKTRRYQMEPDDGEVYFALYCFFDDLNHMRDHLQQIWRDYKHGKETLVTASVITNTAFQLVQQAEQELMTTLPQFKSYYDIAGMFYLLVCELRGLDSEFREEDDDVVNPLMLDVAEWLYLPVASAVGSFLNVIRTIHMPGLKPGHLGVYDPSRDRSQMTARQRVRDDRIILMELFPEFEFVREFGVEQLPVPDELTKGLVSTFSIKEDAPLWVIYALQVFLDITHTLGSDVSRGLADLRGTGVRASISFTQYFRSKGIHTFTNWPESNEQGLVGFSKFVKQWAVDDVFKWAKGIIFQDPSEAKRSEPFALLSRHPILCGLLKFKVHTGMKDAGIALTAGWGSILYVAHLYNACRQGGYLSTEEHWPDMELIMDIHSRETMFSGQLPETPDQWLKTMSLMLGYAPESFAKFIRVSHMKHSKKGPKMMTSKSPVSDIFHTEYFRTGNAALTVHSIQKLLDQWDEPLDYSVLESGHTTISTTSSLLQTQWAKSHKLTPLQFLYTMRHAMAVEEHMLCFDYFSFHLRCLALLRRLRDVLDAKFRQYFGDEYIENETQLLFLVAYIFMVARGTAGFGEISKLRSSVKSSIMIKAAQVVREFIEREGGVEADKLGTVSFRWAKYAEWAEKEG